MKLFFYNFSSKDPSIFILHCPPPQIMWPILPVYDWSPPASPTSFPPQLSLIPHSPAWSSGRSENTPASVLSFDLHLALSSAGNTISPHVSRITSSFWYFPQLSPPDSDPKWSTPSLFTLWKCRPMLITHYSVLEIFSFQPLQLTDIC